jgi:hypothetical protein
MRNPLDKFKAPRAGKPKINFLDHDGLLRSAEPWGKVVGL